MLNYLHVLNPLKLSGAYMSDQIKSSLIQVIFESQLRTREAMQSTYSALVSIQFHAKYYDSSTCRCLRHMILGYPFVCPFIRSRLYLVFRQTDRANDRTSRVTVREVLGHYIWEIWKEWRPIWHSGVS